MKKSYLPISDVKNESLDVTKRLFRSIADVVRALDENRQKASTIPDLFTQTTEAQRMKLRDYCERLMFLDPVGFGRKSEELLWRKGYYEVVSTAKRLHKGPLWKPVEECQLRSHLQAGIGHYHHLLLRFQLDFQMDLRGIVDFPLVVADDGLKKGKSTPSNKDKPSDGALEWANQAVHRCLIYLGDLGRYLTDLCPGYHSELPARYYHQALYWKPECGMPHNQLGTLVGNYNYFLDSAYHYMRCLMSAQSFEGTESNLCGVLERSWKQYESTLNPSPIHQLISKFLCIVDFCYYDKKCPDVFPQLCHEAIDGLNSCNEMLQSVQDETNGEEGISQPEQLTDDILFKLTLVSIMCTQQLQNKGSDSMNIVLAVTLAVMNYLILKAVERMEEMLPPPQPPPILSLNGHKRRRRRRRRRHSSELSSDLSDEEEVLTLNSDSDMSEEELVFDAHTSDSENEQGIENGEFEVITELDPKKVQLGETPALEKNAVLDHFEHLCLQGFLLQTIKVCLDWLVNNLEVLRACAQAAKPMLSRTTTFLNHLTLVPLPPPANEQPDIINNGVLENERIPLVEEVSVRGLVALKPVYQHIDWAQLKTKCLSPRQEAYVRICKLVQLGKKLANAEGTDITYDQNRNWFELNSTQSTSPTLSSQDNKVEKEEKGKLMKDMGQLWLKAEVRQLESRMKRTSALPPYLVLDCDALIHHVALIKQLVHSKKFIMLVPSVVVSSLDEQKRVNRRVRDTIRWLEAQFRQGNRFLRAQRPNEHLALPLIKYPKKKDKEAWMFFQVSECCHYMSQQMRQNKDSLVTLLTGSRTLLSPQTSNGFSPLGIANTAGFSIEHIETFHSKWKTSSKSHG